MNQSDIFFVLLQIFVDTAVKREVLSLTVLCSNKSNECDWKGELRDLQVCHFNHLND